MNIKLYLLVLAMVMLRDITIAQMEGDQWVTGYWSNNNPAHSIMFFDFRNANLAIVQKPSIKMFIQATTSTICSPIGEPVLWTNGMQIMGKDGNYVADTISFDIDGNYWQSWAPQGHLPVGFLYDDGALILPIPEHLNEYSIITHFAEDHPLFGWAVTKFLEAKVEQNQNGNFELMYKDSLIGQRELWYTGTISAIRHANGRDWWLIDFLDDSPKYYVHLLDPSGIHFDHVGEIDVIVKEGLGQAVFSSKGNYFARMDAISPDSGEFITLYEFDRCEGSLTRKNTFHENDGLFTGVAFSPSERYLYADNNTELWQWDLQSKDITSSQTLVDTFDGFEQPVIGVMQFGPMVNAPDGKIYIIPSAGSSKYLHVIDRPDLPASECKFLQHHIPLNVWNARTAPNIPNYRLGPLDNSFCDTLGLNNLPKSRWRYEPDSPDDPTLIRFTDLAFFDPQTWHWDFDDGSYSDLPAPLHVFEPGLYHVCQTVSNQFAIDSTCHWIEVLSTALKEELNEISPDISIIPNPFHNYIVIQSRQGNFRTVHMQLYDMHGRLVFNQSECTIPAKIYLPDYAPGIYLCSLMDEKGLTINIILMKE
jgi:Secretion system C-terminal sorting domain